MIACIKGKTIVKAFVATALLLTVSIAPAHAGKTYAQRTAEKQRNLQAAFRAATGQVAPPRRYSTPAQALLAFQAALYHAHSFSQLLPYMGEKETMWQKNSPDSKLLKYKAKYYVFKPKIEQQLVDSEDSTKAEVALNGTVFQSVFGSYKKKTMRFAMTQENGMWKFNGSAFMNSKMKAYKRVNTNWQSYFKKASTGQVAAPAVYKSPSKAFMAYQAALLRASSFGQVVPYLSSEQGNFDKKFVYPSGLTKSEGMQKSLLDYKFSNYMVKPQIKRVEVHSDGQQAYLIINAGQFSSRDGKMKRKTSRRYMFKEGGIWRYDGLPQAAVTGKLPPGLHRVGIREWKH